MSNKKRQSNEDTARHVESNDMEVEDLVFEDPFGDEFDEEDGVNDEEYENEDEDEKEDSNYMQSNMDDENEHKQVWRPGVDALEDGETLEYDPSAYVTYHSLKTEWPCLSFDILKDNLGDGRHRVKYHKLVLINSNCYLST
jgi:ribosome assembly protein RRB1